MSLDAQPSAAPAVTVRPATPDDAAALAVLAQELLAFYGLTSPYQRSYMAHAIANGAFTDTSGIEVLIAEDGAGHCQGFLAFGRMFALANCRKSLFIQDIFVTRRARAKGVGQALMAAMLALAEDQGIEQIDWTMDPWNDQAKRFYEKLGPLLRGNKVFYRLVGPKFGHNRTEAG